MKVIVIPDVHLKPFMFYEAEKLMKAGAAERAVCLMDIPDDWNMQMQLQLYEQTYDAAIDFAKEFPDTIWCYGNHDLCYIWNQRESGYSPMASHIVNRKLVELRDALPAGNELRYVQRLDNVIFCHGGLTSYFVSETVNGTDIDYEDTDAVLSAVNALGCEQMWTDISPIWHRPQYSLMKLYQEDKFLQVVGHTPVEKISRTGNVISCDVFSTDPEGNSIGEREYLIIDTVTLDTRACYG